MKVRKAVLRDPVAVKCLLWHMKATALASRVLSADAPPCFRQVMLDRAEKIEREARTLRNHARVLSAVV